MTDWQSKALCTASPEMWFTPGDRAEAMHICRVHCPVVERCLRDALRHPPKDGVQGGVAFNNDSRPFPPGFHLAARTCPKCTFAPPRDPPTDTGVCATYSGYRRHLRRYEHACDPCKKAAVRRWHDQKKAKGATRAPKGEE